MTRILLIIDKWLLSNQHRIIVSVLTAQVVVSAVLLVFLLSACGGHGQDNKQGTSVVDQPKEQTNGTLR